MDCLVSSAPAVERKVETAVAVIRVGSSTMESPKKTGLADDKVVVAPMHSGCGTVSCAR